VRRLMGIPGIGPICATALEALAPPPETFVKGRDFAAWLGLVPRQHSSGGKARLRRVSKMGQRDLRRLLIIGAMSVVRWALRRGTGRLLARPHVGAEAADARCDCAGEQDGAGRLGFARQG
jgi:transposase